MRSFINAKAPGCRLGLRQALPKIRGLYSPYFAVYLVPRTPSWRCAINPTRTHSSNAIASRMSSPDEYFPIRPSLKLHRKCTFFTHPESQRPGMVALFEDQRTSSYFLCAGIFNFRFLAFRENNLVLNKSWMRMRPPLSCRFGVKFVSEARARLIKVQILRELKLSPSTVKSTGST